eukprot:3379508-Pyramimonas_sp.AAC.1
MSYFFKEAFGTNGLFHVTESTVVACLQVLPQALQQCRTEKPSDEKLPTSSDQPNNGSSYSPAGKRNSSSRISNSRSSRSSNTE